MFNLKKLIAYVVVIIIGVHTGNAALVAYGIDTFIESAGTEGDQSTRIRADHVEAGIDN